MKCLIIKNKDFSLNFKERFLINRFLKEDKILNEIIEKEKLKEENIKVVRKYTEIKDKGLGKPLIIKIIYVLELTNKIIFYRGTSKKFFKIIRDEDGNEVEISTGKEKIKIKKLKEVIK